MAGDQNTKFVDLVPTPSEWTQLSVMDKKRNAFSKDLYFRECWADMAEVFGPLTMSVLNSVAVMNMKPDAIVGRRMRSILEFVVARGFLPIAVAPLHLTRHSMRELWRYDWRVYPVDRLAFSTFWYMSTEILVLVLQDNRLQRSFQASVRLSQLRGHALPEKRTSNDLRTMLRPPNRVLNFVHVADEPVDVVREIGIFFDRPERKSFIRKIEKNAGLDRSGEVLKEIYRLEARYPDHDLDLTSSLNRLEKSSAITAKAIGYLRKLHSNGEKLGWDELCSIINPMSENIDRWDFICIASNIIRVERGA